MSQVTHFTDDTNLRIWAVVEHYPVTPLIEFLDFTTIGLVTEPPVYGTGGVKQYQEYWNDEDEWVVRKVFQYGEDGVYIRFQWADKEGGVGLEKIEHRPLNSVEIAKIQRSNRERTILYLQASAADTPAAPLINAIIIHYKYEIELWIYNATDDLKNAILNEPEYMDEAKTIPNPIHYYLTIPTVPPNPRFPEGLTVGTSILYQIAEQP